MSDLTGVLIVALVAFSFINAVRVCRSENPSIWAAIVWPLATLYLVAWYF
tara:strand:- start:403 stop:552 length:150 start_codon:yes stop_codon:yes gene_type:complete